MAKMFYSLNETAQRLGMSSEDVQELARSGQLEEFRDEEDQLIFKVQQVDLLAGDDSTLSQVGEDSSKPEMGVIPLAESGELEPLSLSSSASGTGMDIGLNEQTGISIFDADEDEDTDPSAATQITSDITTPAFDMDAAASGSGLYDLTGIDEEGATMSADLLDDVYSDSGESDTGISGLDSGGMSSTDTADLFEGGGSATQDQGLGAPMAAMAAEPYDGAWSGLAGGAALGAVFTLMIAMGLALLGMAGLGVDSLIADLGSSAPLIIGGGGLGLMLVFAVVGWLLLRNS